MRALSAELSKSKPRAPHGRPTLQYLLTIDNLAVMIFEGTSGDGWDLQCPCPDCKREWLNVGWVCPVMYYHSEMEDLMMILENWHRDIEADAWDARVLARFEDMYVPMPDSDSE